MIFWKTSGIKIFRIAIKPLRLKRILSCSFVQRSKIESLLMENKNFDSENIFPEYAKYNLAFLGVFDADDVLNQTTINNGGNFTLEGSQWEFGGIEPYMKVIHQCDVSSPL